MYKLNSICPDVGKPHVVSEDDCKEAADIFARGRYEVLKDPKPYLPKGCSLHAINEMVTWNPSYNEGRHPIFRPICLKSGMYPPYLSILNSISYYYKFFPRYRLIV